MSIPSTSRGRHSKWVRNGALADYLGISDMTLWRWKRDPSLNFPQPTEVNGIEFTHIDQVDEWMRSRIVSRYGK